MNKKMVHFLLDVCCLVERKVKVPHFGSYTTHNGLHNGIDHIIVILLSRAMSEETVHCFRLCFFFYQNSSSIFSYFFLVIIFSVAIFLLKKMPKNLQYSTSQCTCKYLHYINNTSYSTSRDAHRSVEKSV